MKSGREMRVHQPLTAPSPPTPTAHANQEGSKKERIEESRCIAVHILVLHSQCTSILCGSHISPGNSSKCVLLLPGSSVTGADTCMDGSAPTHAGSNASTAAPKTMERLPTVHTG